MSKDVQYPEMTFGGCGKCVCKSCLYRWSARCPYGKCFDDERAKNNPYDQAHPDKPPRTAWSNWKTDQAFWCRGGVFYPAYECKHFAEYTGCEIRECLKCNVAVYQDGYMNCGLIDIAGCESCYEEFERKQEREETMSEENMWYLEMSYEDSKLAIEADLKIMSQNFIEIGFFLKRIRDNGMFREDGFSNIWDFAQQTYGIGKSTASRWMSMNDKFSTGGNSPFLDEQYREFGKSQLQEMLYLGTEQIKQVKPEMPAKEIRAIREPESDPEAVAPAQQREEELRKSNVDDEQSPKEEHSVSYFVLNFCEKRPMTLKAILAICKDHKTNSDRAKAIQKHVGLSGGGDVEFGYTFSGYADGVKFEADEQTVHLTYIQFVKEIEEFYGPFSDPEPELAPVALAQQREDEPICQPDKESPEDSNAEAVAIEADYKEIQSEAYDLEYFLAEQRRKLDEMNKIEGVPEKPYARQKVIVAALENSVMNPAVAELQELMCDKYCKYPDQCGSPEELSKHCDSCQMIQLWNFINRNEMTINKDLEQAVQEMEAIMVKLEEG